MLRPDARHLAQQVGDRWSRRRARVQPAARPADRAAFAFHADAFNLEAITPPWLGFRIVTPGPIEMGAGTLIDYRLRLHRVPVRWRTRIEAWEPPRRFVDAQLKGPYSLWEHTHSFEADGAGSVEIRDRVRYALPLGRLGVLAHSLFVRRDLERIFDYRRAAVARRLAAAPGTCRAPGRALSNTGGAMDVDDAEIVRGAYDALNRGDVAGALAALDADAEWYESPALPETGSYHGRSAIQSFLQQFLQSWERFHQEPEEVVSAGDKLGVFIHLTATGKGSGAPVDARYAHVWTMRDGVGVRVDAFYDREAALAAIGR